VVVNIRGEITGPGDKHEADQSMNVQSLLTRGIAVANVSYRSSVEAPFPAALQDVRAAVRWLRVHAVGYGLDPARIAVWGMSGGGYLATMAGVTSGHANEVLDDASLGNSGVSSSVQAGVSLYGPSDGALLAMAAQSDNASRLAMAGNERLLQEFPWFNAGMSDPIAWITSTRAGSLPPLLLGLAEADFSPVGQLVKLADAIRLTGGSVQMQTLPAGVEQANDLVAYSMIPAGITFLARHLVFGHSRVM
jgi:acetyl esterase/lipase